MITKILSIFSACSIVVIIIIFNLYMSANNEKIKAQQSLEVAKLSLTEIKKDFTEQSIKNDLLNIDVGRISQERDQVNAKLNSYRDRENVIKKKPKLIERIANRATASMFNNICAASGGDCKNKTTKANTDNADSN